MPPISPLTPLTPVVPRVPTPPSAGVQVYATLDAYPGAEGAQRRAPAVWAERQFSWQPFDAPLYGKPGPYAGELAVRGDFGFVQPSWHPTDRLEHDGLTVEHFYHRPQTTLACMKGLPNPRETGNFGPQTSAVAMLTRELVQQRAHTLPAAPGLELGPVVLHSRSLHEVSRAQGAGVLPPPPAQPEGMRPAGLTWPAFRLPANDTDFLRTYAAPGRTHASLNAAGRPPPALLRPSTRTLDCGNSAELPASAPAATAAGAVPDSCIGRLEIRQFSGPTLPVAVLAERFSGLEHLSLADCPKLLSLANLAQALASLRSIQLLACPMLCTVGADNSAFLPAAAHTPARVTLTSVLLCPQFVVEHDTFLAAARPHLA